MNQSEIQRLRHLYAAANPRDWKVARNLDRRQTERPTIRGRNGFIIHPDLGGFNFPADAELVVAAVNALTELLDIAEKAQIAGRSL